MDPRPERGDQCPEIGAAISGLKTLDASDERRESSHEKIIE